MESGVDLRTIKEYLGHPDGAIMWYPAAGKWCIKEVVGHLIEEDERDFTGRIRLILDQDEPHLAVTDQDEAVRMRHDCDKNTNDLLSERGLPNGIGGAVVVGDYLYGTEIGQALVAVEFTTGKVKWKAESIGWSSVAYADGHLYIHNQNGDFVLVEATPEGYREKGRFTPPNQPKYKQAGQYAERAFAYPVIANGRLYIRDLGTLWAYDIKASR